MFFSLKFNSIKGCCWHARRLFFSREAKGHSGQTLIVKTSTLCFAPLYGAKMYTINEVRDGDYLGAFVDIHQWHPLQTFFFTKQHFINQQYGNTNMQEPTLSKVTIARVRLTLFACPLENFIFEFWKYAHITSLQWEITTPNLEKWKLYLTLFQLNLYISRFKIL